MPLLDAVSPGAPHPVEELEADFTRLAGEHPGLERSKYAMYYLFTLQSDANKAEWGPTEEAARTAAGWATYFTILDHTTERRTLASDWARLRGA